MAGYPVDMTAINGRVGSVVLNLRIALDDVDHIKTYLDGKTDAELTALGFTTAEVAVMKSAFTDLHNLSLIAHGQGTQAQANDFFFWAKQLLGLN